MSENNPKNANKNTTPLGRFRRDSADRIYRSVMRSGGEPFGKPYEVGPQTLTEKIVNFFKQRGFFGFESLEKPATQPSKNKFSRYGATRFRGPYPNTADDADSKPTP